MKHKYTDLLPCPFNTALSPSSPIPSPPPLAVSWECNLWCKHNEALKCLDDAITLDPKKDNPRFYKGIVLGKMKRHEEALNCFQNVYRNNRNHLDAYFQTGIQLAELGRHEQAVKVFDNILKKYEKFRDNANVIYAKARSKAALDETGEALELLRLATKRSKEIKKWAVEEKAFDRLLGTPEFEDIVK